MAQYGLQYRLRWNTVPQVLSASLTVPAQAMQVLIYDTTQLIEDSQTPTIIDLIAGATPLVIKVVNNDEDKFSPIRAKQAIIEFKSDANQFQEVDTFADSEDNRWKVECSADGQIIFVGFLMLTDSQQNHLPDPNIVVLTASDHLALLKDIPLTTDEGLNPQGKYRLAELIALCLKKTGIALGIGVVNNLRHGSASFTYSVTFNNPNTITGLADTSFFYVGQQVTISNTSANNITTLVTDVTETTVTVSGTFTTDFEPTAIFTDESSLKHIYDGTYLDALTFEAAIGVSQDCYTVLQKILGEDCFLTQWNGRWWIMRIDEYDGNPIYPASFSAHGVFLSFDAVTDFGKAIGAAETRRLANADALRRFDRPHGFIKETGKIDYPLEIPCNMDFSRGDFIADLPEETNADGQVEQVKSYEVECWQFLSRQGGVANQIGFYDQPPIANSDAYIKKFLFNDTELRREVVIETPLATGTGVPYIKASAIDVTISDKVKVSFDLSYSNIGATTGFVDTPVMVGLFADSGNIYWWVAYDSGDPALIPYWQLTPPTGPGSVIPDMYQGAVVEAESLSINLESPPAPETGEIRVYLINFYASQIAAHYKNLSIEVLAYINGSYLTNKSFYNKVTSDPVGYFSANRDKEVFIFDGLRKLWKGVLLFYNGSKYILTSKWYTANVFALGSPPDQTYMHPYGYIQAYSVWNQYRNANRIFPTSVLGQGSFGPDLLDKYSLTDSNPNTNNRFFLLISFEQNWKTCLWSGVFIEVYNSVIGHNYDDDHEFKFLTK